MAGLAMGKASEIFLESPELSDRLKAAKKKLLGGRIADLSWERFHDDEMAILLVLDNGQRIRGRCLRNTARKLASIDARQQASVVLRNSR